MVLISVIIPTYNQAQYLINCLDSVFKQDFIPKKYEVIVADDNSADKTQAVLKKYLEKHTNLKLIRNKENRGPYYSRNKCIEIAKGKIFAFTDSDCILPTNWLKIIEKKFHNPKIVCVQGTQTCSGRWGKYMREKEAFIKVIKKRESLDTKNLIINRDLLLRYKFDESQWFKNFRVGIADILLGYRLHKDGIRVDYDPKLIVNHVTNKLSEVISRARKWGKAQAILYVKYEWEHINPKFRWPLIVLILYILLGFFLLMRKKGVFGAFATSILVFLMAVNFKNTIKYISCARAREKGSVIGLDNYSNARKRIYFD